MRCDGWIHLYSSGAERDDGEAGESPAGGPRGEQEAAAGAAAGGGRRRATRAEEAQGRR